MKAAAGALRTNAWRYASGELAWLVRSRNARWIPYACVYETAKFAGLQLGRHHRRLPPRLRRRLSAHRGWWDAREPAAGADRVS